jgi:hypothetical protein
MSGMATMVCMCCLYPGMRVRLDKKGRPFFQCSSCSTIIFARLGEVGIHQVCSALALLENAEAIEFVRARSAVAAAQPDALANLLRPSAPVAVASGPGKVAGE